MKKFIFVLPLMAMFTYCSSSRKATTPPAGPGISNVNIVSGTDTIKGSSIAVNADTRDWAYTSSRETTLQGNWTLHGMTTEEGTWSTTDQWNKDTTTNNAEPDFSANAADTTQTFHSGSATMDATERNKGKKKASKSSFQATSSLKRYDSLMANSASYSDSVLNANLKPYEYWKRIPTVSINPTSLVFTGSTGCNTMSGSFNFSGKDIKFNKNITTSKMACNDYNEAAFLNQLRKADNYTINNEGMLELRQGQTLLMVFSRQS